MKREALFCVSTRVSLKSSAWQGFRNFAAKKKCHQKFWVRKNFGSEENIWCLNQLCFFFWSVEVLC